MGKCDVHTAVEGDIEAIKKTLDRKTQLIDDLYTRVGALEVRDATQNERINSLCQKMEDLAKVIENWMVFAQSLFWKILAAAGGLILILAGFFIWYIESLPR